MDGYKATINLQNIRRYKNDWCLGKAVVIASEPEINENKISVKGVLPDIKEDVEYQVFMQFESHPTYGDQYFIKSICPTSIFDLDDDIGRRKFLSAIFTDYQVENMYAVYSNPFELFESEDYAGLCRIKGCKMKTAEAWVRKFHNNLHKAKIYAELGELQLSNAVIDKLINRYASADMVIRKVKENPYILVNDVDGIGWKTADKIALNSGISEYGVLRVKNFIIYYLNSVANEGLSWIIGDELLGEILDNIGDDVEDRVITTALKELVNEKILWHSDDKQKFGLYKYYDVEYRIAQELIRLRNAKSDFQYSNWKEIIKEVEDEQGWSFTTEQLSGIQTGLENNISIITGLAGTGKSSIIRGILAVLKDYDFCQTSLAGRAASKLKEITGEEGYTIHRLLNYPDEKNGKQLFGYHDENQLPYDIYIIDEISMIDSQLFYYLLRAIPSGSKVYMLGDVGQLESIGAGNIAFDMINSEEIPVVELTKIHRQAEKSAIITESIKLRKGIQIAEKEWVGEKTLGELQDLTIICHNDTSNTFYNIMKVFYDLMAKDDFDIMKTQIIVPMKTNGDACTYKLNKAAQASCNPPDVNKKEVEISVKDYPYILREGDKIINMKNNYKIDPPIYNGNIGVIKKMFYDYDIEKDVMLVDFIGVGEVYIPRDCWSSLEPAYAITTHKMQGSSADYVIYGIDFSAYALLTREQLYTGITRSRKHCYLVAQTSALRFATFKQGVSEKQTFLKDLLYNLAHPKFIF